MVSRGSYSRKSHACLNTNRLGFKTKTDKANEPSSTIQVDLSGKEESESRLR